MCIMNKQFFMKYVLLTITICAPHCSYAMWSSLLDYLSLDMLGALSEQRDALYDELYAAVREKNVHLIKKLLSWRICPEERFKAYALALKLNGTSTKGFEIAKLLLEKGPNPLISWNDVRPLQVAIVEQSPQVVEYLINNGNKKVLNENPGALLVYACAKASDHDVKKIVKLLIDAGVDVYARNGNTSRYSPLEIAARRNHLPLVKLLVYRGGILYGERWDHDKACEVTRFLNGVQVCCQTRYYHKVDWLLDENNALRKDVKQAVFNIEIRHFCRPHISDICKIWLTRYYLFLKTKQSKLLKSFFQKTTLTLNERKIFKKYDLVFEDHEARWNMAYEFGGYFDCKINYQ